MSHQTRYLDHCTKYYAAAALFDDQDNHALLMAMVLACMALGVCLGACMAFLCHQQEFMNLPWLKHMVEVS